MSDHAHRTDLIMRGFLVALVIMNLLVLGAACLIWWASRDVEFAPFQLPVQTVLNRIPGRGDTASAFLGDPIVVRAWKCNTSSRPVESVNTKAWASLLPEGNTYVVTQHNGKVFPPGCKTTTFVNVVPPPVVSQMAELLQTRPYVVWVLRGTQRAVHAHAVTQTWTTQPFYIYPKEK